jgi:hypothetical protein
MIYEDEDIKLEVYCKNAKGEVLTETNIGIQAVISAIPGADFSVWVEASGPCFDYFDGISKGDVAAYCTFGKQLHTRHEQ